MAIFYRFQDIAICWLKIDDISSFYLS